MSTPTNLTPLTAPSDKLASYFCEQLEQLAKRSFHQASAADLALVEVFVKHLLSSWCRADFQPSRAQLLELVSFNETLSNLVAMSSVRSTDACMEQVLSIGVNDAQSLGKLLVLYSARNSRWLEPAPFFAIDAELASRWFYGFLSGVSWAVLRPEQLAKLCRLAAQLDARLQFAPKQLDHAYFSVSYLGEPLVAPLRRQLHQLIANTFPWQLPLAPVASGGAIALVTARWVADNVVYRALAPFIDALCQQHAVTLLHLGKPRDDLVTTGFVAVENFQLTPDGASQVQLQQRFAMVLIADIGLNMESVFLASQRLAPIQVALCGHPESSFSPVMDYFVHGADVVEQANAQADFGERLLLIPGCGQAITEPPFAASQSQPTVDDDVRIACPWNSSKLHYQHLQRLQQALTQVQTNVTLVFLGLPSDGYWAIQQELASQLGAENIECWPMLTFDEYRAQLQSCHFAVDTYPFGGFITIIDLLWLRKPVLCLAGARTYNRNAAYLQRKLGLEAMVTHNGAEFVSQLIRLIDDRTYRQALVTQVAQADLTPLFDNSQASAAFVAAIDYVLQHHSRLQQQVSKLPICIRADLTVELAST